MRTDRSPRRRTRALYTFTPPVRGHLNAGWAGKLAWFFLQGGSSSAYLSLISFETISLDCIVTAVISACIFLKNPIKIGKFLCSHFNIEGGRKHATFLAYYALLFQKGKNTVETQNKRFVWGRRCD